MNFLPPDLESPTCLLANSSFILNLSFLQNFERWRTRAIVVVCSFSISAAWCRQIYICGIFLPFLQEGMFLYPSPDTYFSVTFSLIYLECSFVFMLQWYPGIPINQWDRFLYIAITWDSRSTQLMSISLIVRLDICFIRPITLKVVNNDATTYFTSRIFI